MYNFDEFVIRAKYELEKELRYQYPKARVSIMRSRKVNHEMIGLKCDDLSRDPISPTLYMESIYQTYLEHGNMNAVISRATEAIDEAMQKSRYVMNKINDFENVESDIIFQLIHTEQNKELLETMPHRNFMNMSIIYRCVLDISEEGILSAPIDNSFARRFGLEEEKLYELAYENTRYVMRPVVLSVEDVIRRMSGSLDIDDEKLEEMLSNPKWKLYALTNESQNWGAASVLYKGKLQSLAERLGSDLYMIPSSVHEMLITEANPELLETIENTIFEVNQTMALEDRLSNDVYMYDRKTNSITQVTDSSYKLLDGEPTEGMRMEMC